MNRVRHNCVRLYMEKTDSFCAGRSDEYPVKIVLGSAMTVTVLFIMILPEVEMGLMRLVEHQCGIYPVPVQSFFIKKSCEKSKY